MMPILLIRSPGFTLQHSLLLVAHRKLPPQRRPRSLLCSCHPPTELRKHHCPMPVPVHSVEVRRRHTLQRNERRPTIACRNHRTDHRFPLLPHNLPVVQLVHPSPLPVHHRKHLVHDRVQPKVRKQHTELSFRHHIIRAQLPRQHPPTSVLRRIARVRERSNVARTVPTPQLFPVRRSLPLQLDLDAAVHLRQRQHAVPVPVPRTPHLLPSRLTLLAHRVRRESPEEALQLCRNQFASLRIDVTVGIF